MRQRDVLTVGLGWVFVLGGAVSSALAQPAPAAAPPGGTPDRVVVTAESIGARSCAEASCRVLIELPRGQALTVLKSEGTWYQVMLRLPGNAMTTGWIEAASVAAAPPVARATGARTTPAARPGGTQVVREPSECLTCVATRQPTREEWDAALAAAATRKADPAARVRREPQAAAPASLRSTSERMRDDLEQRYGADLRHLAGVARTLDGDLEQYLTTCYDRFLPPVVEGAAPRTPAGSGDARPATGREARFAIWSGSPAFAWTATDAGRGRVPLTDETAALCPGLWSDVLARARDLETALRNLELVARQSDIYPGVVREVYATYGLAPAR
jgi:hypothetical protein